MDALGVVAVPLVLVVLIAVALYAVSRRRGRTATGAEPRTVADLVRLRATQGKAVPAAVAPPRPAGVGASTMRAAAAPPASRFRPPPAPDVAERDAVPTTGRTVVATQAAEAGSTKPATRQTAPGDRSPVDVARPAPDVPGDGRDADTSPSASPAPGGRAARLPGRDHAAVPVVPQPRSAPDSALHEPATAPDAPRAGTPTTPAPQTPAPQTAAPQTAALQTAAPQTPAPTVGAPTIPAPPVVGPQTPAPTIPAQTIPAPTIPAAGTPETPATRTPAAPTPAVAEAATAPAGHPPAGLPRQPTGGPAPAPPVAPIRRPLADTAAEQVAADLALLRTFGVAGPGSVPEPDGEVTALSVRDRGAPQAAPGAAQTVSFQVVGRDGRGVAGARATLHDGRGRVTACMPADATGHGALSAPRPGGFVLVTAAPGYQSGATALTVGDAPVQVEVSLTRCASIFGIAGGKPGSPAGARVVLMQDGETVDAVRTGADGGYRFADLTAGEYGVSVVAPDCEPVALLVLLADEQAARHDIALVPSSPDAVAPR